MANAATIIKLISFTELRITFVSSNPKLDFAPITLLYDSDMRSMLTFPLIDAINAISVAYVILFSFISNVLKRNSPNQRIFLQCFNHKV